jgi:hypothetical protein
MGTRRNGVIVACCLLLAVGTRPLARTVSVEYAAWSALPLTESDLALVPPTAGGATEAGLVAVSALDPWGRPFRFERSRSGARIYSTGPNERDEGGAGDDVVVAVQPLYKWVSWSPALFGGAAVLWLWSCAVLHLKRTPRSGSLGKELLRASGMATLPATLGIVLLIRFAPSTLPVLTLAKVSFPPLVPPAGSIVFVSLLVAVWVRFRPGMAVEDEARAPRALAPRRRRSVLAALALASLAAPLAALLVRAVRSWQRERLVAAARLGLPGSIDELLEGSDLDLVRAFAAMPPRGFSFADNDASRFDQVARIGSEALAAVIETLARPGESVDQSPWFRLRSGEDPTHWNRSWEYVASWDPHLTELGRAMAARPGDFAGLLLVRTRSFVNLLGREEVIRLLALLLDDKRLLSIGADHRSRVCDEAAGEISIVLYDSIDFELPISAAVAYEEKGHSMDAHTIEKWDAAIGRVRGWWLRNGPVPKLPAAGWIRVHAKGLAAGGALHVEVWPHASLDAKEADPGGPEVTWRLGPYTPGRRTLIISRPDSRGSSLSVRVDVRAGETVAVEADFASGKVDVAGR